MAPNETTTTTATTTPIPVTSETTNATGPSQPAMETPSARQVEDLNFYLRRLTLGGNGDISQIESFGGGTDFEMFLEAVSSVGVHYGWTEAQKLRTVEMKLKDKAREYYGALLPNERPTNMTEMRNWMRRVFEKRLTVHAGKRELEKCVRNPGEPLGEYAQRLKVVANKMFPANSLTSTEKLYHRNMLLVNQFIEGLEGRLANEILRAGEFYNLDECLTIAEQCEEIVSRMVEETRYDLRMSNIRRIQGNPGRSNQDTEVTRYHYEESGGEEIEHSQNRNRNDAMVSSQELVPFRREQQQQGSNPDTQLDRNTYPRQGGQRMRQRSPRRQDRGGFRRNNFADRRQPRRFNHPHTSMTTFIHRFPYMKNRCISCGEPGHIAIGCKQPTKIFCFHCGKEGEICSLNSTRQATDTPR